ncbi:MAG: hypothetical protein ACPG7U_04130 [Holosporaceae bacterium]
MPPRNDILDRHREGAAPLVIAKAQPVAIHLPETKAAKAHWIATSE